MSTIRDLFPFGDLDESIVSRVGERFPVEVSALAPGLMLGKAIVGAIEHLAAPLEEAGLTPARWRLLIALVVQAEVEGATIGELAGHLGIKEPTVTATVDRLEGEGLVTRTRDDADRRVVRVALTPAGATTVASIAPQIGGRVSVFVTALGGADEVRALTVRIKTAITTGMDN